MNLNHVCIQGNLGREPEVKYISGKGIPIASFSVAVTERWGDKEKTHWIPCQAWYGLAEKMRGYGKKDHLTVVGSLKVEEWVDKKTQLKRSKMLISAKTVTSTFTGERTEKAESRPPAPAPAPTPEPDPFPSDDDVPF